MGYYINEYSIYLDPSPLRKLRKQTVNPASILPLSTIHQKKNRNKPRKSNGHKKQDGQIGCSWRAPTLKQWSEVYLSVRSGVTLAEMEPQSLSWRQPPWGYSRTWANVTRNQRHHWSRNSRDWLYLRLSELKPTRVKSPSSSVSRTSERKRKSWRALIWAMTMPGCIQPHDAHLRKWAF